MSFEGAPQEETSSQGSSSPIEPPPKAVTQEEEYLIRSYEELLSKTASLKGPLTSQGSPYSGSSSEGACPEATPVPQAPLPQAAAAQGSASAGSPASGEEASVSDLTLQLLSVSSRRAAQVAGVVAKETYVVAQRVARFGWEQVNDQLHRHGITLEKEDEDHLKMILILLLIVVAAIFLLGMDKQKFTYRWDLYYPN